ncbi:MAG: O-methyltransferase [Bdellovibrionaceae bacterium]|nr:O-methyltransferase [Pseudobdellovibrionaceae bacterium]
MDIKDLSKIQRPKFGDAQLLMVQVAAAVVNSKAIRKAQHTRRAAEVREWSLMGISEDKGFGQSDPKVVEYAHRVFKPEDPLLTSIREESRRQGLPDIEVGVFDGLHLEVLVGMTGARRVVEIGTLGGYSGIHILRGMQPTGHLHTFELNPHHADVARENFNRAGFGAERVTVHVGPALTNLANIEREAPFDVVFVDADKVHYPDYLRWAMEHLRIGGVVIGDNTFGWGQVYREKGVSDREDQVLTGLRTFNDLVANSGRFRATILPTAEGLTVGVKVR